MLERCDLQRLFKSGHLVIVQRLKKFGDEAWSCPARVNLSVSGTSAYPAALKELEATGVL